MTPNACCLLSEEAYVWMCSCGVRGRVSVSLWQTLLIFNPGGILLKWKAAFQFYNPVDLIALPTSMRTVQLDEQDWPDESNSPQIHLHSLSLLFSKHCGTLHHQSPELTFTVHSRTVQCAKNCAVNPPVSTAVLALLTGALIKLYACVSGSIQSLWHHSLTRPHTCWVQREKVLTTVKEEVALEKMLSQFILRGQCR